MAKVKVRETYELFVCPDCGCNVKPNEQVFCDNCGINLRCFDRIEKQTYYQYEEYEDWQICPWCGEPKIVPTDGFAGEIVERNGKFYTERKDAKCWGCGYRTHLFYKKQETEKRDFMFNPGT